MKELLEVERRRAILRAVLDVAFVGAAAAFVASHFPASLMFSETVTNGGDMGSHYYPAQFLLDELLPSGTVVGWCPGSYAGYPLFQFYFPLPFVLMSAVAMAGILPLTVAFKLATAMGSVLLPVCAYLGLRLAGTPFPGPVFGAMGSLFFLFMTANSMWGGNIPSTLAGEFSFSLGLALTILFLGSLRRTMVSGRGWAWNGLLVALIGLSHGYTLLWAGFSSLWELVTTRDWWRRAWTLVGVHGLAILIMGFWLLPLFAYSPWTTAYDHSWPIQWKEVLPQILWPPAVVALATLVLCALVAWFRREAFPRGLATLWGAMLVATGFYFLGFSFGVVDIRFIPFIQLGLCLAAGSGLGYLLGRLAVPEIWPLVGALLIFPLVSEQVSFIPSWIRWNYSGFEGKATWKTFSGVNEAVKGSYRNPRVVYEHSPDHESLGTIRAFENLPLFSGRSTLEGLYMQSSPTSPFVFYVQSEVSEAHSCPFPNWGCARLDLGRGLEHLRMFNVSHFIARSATVRRAAAAHADLTLEEKIGEYEVYRLAGNDPRYAIPLAETPTLVLTDDWKSVSYAWFKKATTGDVVPAFAREATDAEKASFAAVGSRIPEQVPRVPLDPLPRLSEEMRTDRITINGTRPGHPVLVRISYHPRWYSPTGERIWLAGPSFMMVFPKGESIELRFGDPPLVRTGHIFTGLGWLIFGLAVIPPSRRRFVALGRTLAEAAPIRPVVLLVRSTGEWTPRTRLAVLAASLLVSAGVVGVAAVLLRTVPAEQLYREAQELYREDRLDEALPLFHEARVESPLSMTAIHAYYFEGITLYRQQKHERALAVFEELVAAFPDGLNAPEAQYHVGLCRSLLGDAGGAIEAWEETKRLFPGNQWARYAAERLAELGPPSAPAAPPPVEPE